MKKRAFNIAVLILFAMFANACSNDKEMDKSSDKPALDGILMQTTFDGISMQTELDAYSSDTKRILVYWKNNSDSFLTFGNSWHLEKYNGESWERITKGNESIMFNDIGYGLKPNDVIKHVYWVSVYADSISEGLYRIVTHYYDDKDIPVGPDDEHTLTAEFTVSNDKSKIKRSELDYDNLDNSRDITPHEIEQALSIRIYKDKNSFNTTMVIDGEKYEIGVGAGRWGVVDISLYEADNRKYIIYTYSRGVDSADTIISRIAVFDLQTLNHVFVSKAFSEFDLCVGPKSLEGTAFTVSSLEHWEGEDGGSSGSIIDTIGYLIYENSEFQLKEENQWLFLKQEMFDVDLQAYNHADFNEIVSIIERVRENTFRSVNRELISMYWDIGKYISEKVKDSIQWV